MFRLPVTADREDGVQNDGGGTGEGNKKIIQHDNDDVNVVRAISTRRADENGKTKRQTRTKTRVRLTRLVRTR